MQRRELERQLSEPYVPRRCRTGPGDHDLIQVIIGPRRAGKSFFAQRLVRERGAAGYVNFDDERLIDLQDGDELLAALDSLYDNPRVLLLDEIQNLPRWELFVNRLQRQGYRLTLTGSNAHLLGSELATHLTGRHLPIVLFPFSFPEYLDSQDRDLTTTERAEQFNRYVERGGYPETIVKDVDHGQYLRVLLESVLFKDIVSRHRIRAVQGLDDMTRYLVSNVAQEVSQKTLSRVTRCRSVHTVDKYLRLLEEAFLFFPLRRFSYKVRGQVRANRKVFCIDNGFVSSSAFRLSPDRGKLYENLAAIELHRRQLAGSGEVYFWKNQQQEEVDFVLRRGMHVSQLIQVCVDTTREQTRKREIRALLKAGAELDCRDLLVLTENEEREEHASWFGTTGTIRYQPLWKWLIEQ